MTPDELLTTTRTVRKRLDLQRPVPLTLVRECLEIALQAPSGSNHPVLAVDGGHRRR
jgi:nitroreductase